MCCADLVLANLVLVNLGLVNLGLANTLPTSHLKPAFLTNIGLKGLKVWLKNLEVHLKVKVPTIRIDICMRSGFDDCGVDGAKRNSWTAGEDDGFRSAPPIRACFMKSRT
jgi:hypothetical protein